MISLFPRLTSSTYHLCLLLPLTALSPTLLPFLFGASLPHTTPSALAPLQLLLLSLLLDGHLLATSHPDPALSSRLPPFHFDPRRASGLLQLSALAAIPVLQLLRGARPARLHSSDAAAAAAVLALLSLASAHFLATSLAPFPPRQLVPPHSSIVDHFLQLLNSLLPPVFSLRRPGATFDLRRTLRDLFAVPTGLPVDAPGLERAFTAGVYALLGAVDECVLLNGSGWFDAITSAAGIAAAGWMFTAVIEGEGVGGKMADVVVVMLAVRAARNLAAVKAWRDVLRPLAAVGANWVWVLVAEEFGVVEAVMDAVRVNARSSLLTVVKGVCEVLGAGEGEIAEALFLAVKFVAVMAAALAWEGSRDAEWNEAPNGRRLGDRFFGIE